MGTVLGTDFFQVAAGFSLTEPDIERDRMQSVFDRYKLTQHWFFPEEENILFKATWNEIWEQYPEELDQAEIVPADFASTLLTRSAERPLVAPTENIDSRTQREHAFMSALDTVIDEKITYTPDVRPEDRSQSVTRTLMRSAGDCEDYAIAKYKFARRFGIDADRLAIASVDAQPNEEGGGHAVLLYQDPKGDTFVLNNNSTNNSGLIDAARFFQIRNDPYRAYNENGSYYNSLFSDMNFGEYLSEEGRTRGSIIVLGERLDESVQP